MGLKMNFKVEKKRKNFDEIIKIPKRQTGSGVEVSEGGVAVDSYLKQSHLGAIPN